MMQELNSLKSMISTNSSIIGSTSMANSGKAALLNNLALHTNHISDIWILDSGATDHMTPESSDNFVSYEKVAPGKHAQTADGTLLSVVGVGTVKVQPIGILTNVLHIPKLCVSLVSVQRLAKLKDYHILFDDINAYLCHKVLGWKIGLAKVQHGLYYLPRTDLSTMRGAGLKVAVVRTPPEGRIREAHMRMGHPSFSLLKHMYGHLFKEVHFEKLICEA